MTTIPIIGQKNGKATTIRVRRSDGMWLEVRVPPHVSVPLVKRALADFSRGIAPIYLTDAETEFVADILGAFDEAAKPAEATAPTPEESPL